MKCRKCGAEIADDETFCPVCRSSVDAPDGVSEPVSAVPPMPEPEIPEDVPAEPEDYSAGEAQPIFAETKQPGKKKLNLAASVVIAVIFGLFAMTFSEAGAVFCTISGALSGHAISEEIADLDISGIKIDGIIPDEIKSEISAQAGKISDDIAGIVSSISDGAMNSEQAAEIIRKANINKEIAKILRSYEDYITSGKSEIDIPSELQRIILDAKQVYKDVTGKDVPADFDSDVLSAISGNAEELQKIAPQAMLGVAGEITRVALSPIVWIVLFALAAAFPLLVWAITKRGTAAMMCGGAAYLVSGIWLLISNALTAVVRSVQSSELADVLTQVMSNALNGRLVTCGVVLTVIGAALVIMFIVVKVSRSRAVN